MAVIILLIVGLFFYYQFIQYRKENSKEIKSNCLSNEGFKRKYVSEAVNEIETAYKIATVYPPEFLKDAIPKGHIYFGNEAVGDEFSPAFMFEPIYAVVIHCVREKTQKELLKWFEDLNRNKNFPLWDWKEAKEHNGFGLSSSKLSEISVLRETKGITWSELKNSVISMLSQKHSEWEISDLGTYVAIKYD